MLAGRQAAAGASGRIRIACAGTMTAWVLVPVLRSWRRRFPDVELDLTEYTSADTMLEACWPADGRTSPSDRGPPGPRSTSRRSAARRWWSSRPPSTGSRGLDAVPLAELSAEPLVHYDPGNGIAAWVDQLATERGVVLPQPVLRTGSPRTAAQLAAAGMGVALVPFSALTARTGATVRSIDPVELRDVIVIVAAPHDDLLRRFVRRPEASAVYPGRAHLNAHLNGSGHAARPGLHDGARR